MPYIEHPIAVAALLDEHGYGDEVLAAALLHDVVEDSETTLDELREEFGDEVAGLVGALTDDESIDYYRERKAEHRERVAAADGEALAIYGADKLTNSSTLRAAYAERRRGGARGVQGPARAEAGDLGSRPGDCCARRRRSCPSSTSSTSELSRLRASPRGSCPAAEPEPPLQRQREPEEAEDAERQRRRSTIVAAVPKRTSVISMIAPVIASARKTRPTIAKRLA